MKHKLAIVIIAYNRINSLKRLFYSLLNGIYNEDTVTLYISIDKSKTDVILNYANSIEWPFGEKYILTYEKNLGLRNHILKCGDLLRNFDALIVLEDDIFVSPNFYLFAKQAVSKYIDDARIAGISLYSFKINAHSRVPFYPQESENDVYFINYAQSWGQVWMKKQWEEFINWYNINNSEFPSTPKLPNSISKWPKNSWLKYHIKYCIETNKYFVYPYSSYSLNFHDLGEHSIGGLNIFQVSLNIGKKAHFNLPKLSINCVRYDGFFERKGLAQYLKIEEEQLCVDFYGIKENRENKRYWLTTKKHKYQIINSFALKFVPYELNVIYNLSGNDLFLYDTLITNKNKENHFIYYDESKILKYLYNIPHFSLFIKKIGIYQYIRILFKEIYKLIIIKILKYFKYIKFITSVY